MRPSPLCAAPSTTAPRCSRRWWVRICAGCCSRVRASASKAADQLLHTEWAQPALFTVEYAIGALWRSWGLQPAAMIGHSVGEYVAATLAGVMSLDDALRLIARRGQLSPRCRAARCCR